MDQGTRSSATAAGVLVGRSTELHVLDRALRCAAEGRPQVVIVEGEPGMGKSALLEAFVSDQADQAALRWLRCDPFERNIAFGAAGRLLGDVRLSSGSTAGVGRRLIAALGELDSSAQPAAILAVDDAQWMDRPSAAALRFAVRRLRADRILCLVARRPDPDPVDLQTEDPRDTTVLRLDPLDSGAVTALALQSRALDIPAALADEMVARTGGLTLLVAAMVRDAHTLADLAAEGEVPASAAAAVGQMLSSVDASTRSLVEAAAVMDAPTDLTVLGQTARLADPSDALNRATSAGLTARHRSGAVECAHTLLAEAIRDTLSPSRRRELHARAAEWSSGDRRLFHRAAAADRPDPQLAAELRSAADAAHAAQQYGLAATHRLRARVLSDEAGERERLLLDALIERVDAQDLRGAEDLACLARDAAPTARRSMALGLLAGEKGDVGAARTLLRDALDRAGADNDRVTAARAALAAAILEVRVGDGAAAVDLLRDAPTSDVENAADVRTTMGMGLWQAGEIDRSLALLDAAPLSPGGLAWEVDLLGARGMVNMYAGRPQRALADFDAAIGMVHLWRPSANESRRYVMRSATRYLLGDWDGSAVDAASARALADGPAERWNSAVALAISIDVPAGRGQWDVAEDYLRRAVEASPGVPNVTDLIGRHRLVLAEARTDHAAVLDVLDPIWADAYLERLGRSRTLTPVMRARIASCIAVGRLADAEQDLSRYEKLVRRWPGGLVPAGLGWLRGQLAEARGEAREAQREYARDLADQGLAEFPLQLGQLLHTSGRLEVALGNRREAVDRLTRARDCFTDLRAVPYLQRCNTDLIACGLPSRIEDPLALTPREEDVVALVTRGFSNKQVAAEMFLTVKTVEYHLRNVYTKLGVHSRHELRQRRVTPDT